MIISRNWLQTYFDAALPDAQKIADDLLSHSFEIEGVIEKEADAVIDIDVLPNRAHDCLCHRGIAQEYAAINKLGLITDRYHYHENFTQESDMVHTDIQSPDQCFRYTARKISYITVGKSPAWLTQRLEVLGERSINNIVDATNYVMFDIGNPLHAFDADKVVGTITVRNAQQGEVFHALGGEEYELESGNEITAWLHGVDAKHSGIEFTAAWQPIDMVRVDLAGSIGDWKHTDNASGDIRFKSVDPLYGDAADTSYTVTYYIKDLPTGSAPQSQYVVGISLFPIEGLKAQLLTRMNANYYSTFNPFSRTSSGDSGINSWKIPDYTVIDLHASYNLPVNIAGVKPTVFLHVFNLTDEKYILSNIYGFINILNASSKNKIKAIYYASSSSVYGDQKKYPVTEKFNLFPKNIYAKTKYLNEQIANFYYKKFGISLVGLRLFTVYGKWGRPDMLLFKIFKSHFKNNSFSLNNSGDHFRDFTHIDDVVKIIYLINKKKKYTKMKYLISALKTPFILKN